MWGNSRAFEPIPRAHLFDGEEDGASLDIIAGPEMNFGQLSGLRGLDLVLHLHGLEHQDGLASLDFIPRGRQHLDDSPRHGRLYIPFPLPSLFFPEDFQGGSFFDLEMPAVHEDRMGERVGVDDHIEDVAIDVEQNSLLTDELGGDIVGLAAHRNPESVAPGRLQADLDLLLPQPKQKIHPKASWRNSPAFPGPSSCFLWPCRKAALRSGHRVRF